MKNVQFHTVVKMKALALMDPSSSINFNVHFSMFSSINFLKK